MNFLKPSPRIDRWLTIERDQCRRCEYVVMEKQKDGNTVMRCRQASMSYCIDAREESQPCGPSAAFFKEKK